MASYVGFLSVTPALAPDSSQSNGPPSSTCDPNRTHTHYSSDNDDSETEDEALRKEISRLREK